MPVLRPACNPRKCEKRPDRIHSPALDSNLVKGLLTGLLGLRFRDLVPQALECLFVGVQAGRGLSADSHPHPVAPADPGSG